MKTRQIIFSLLMIVIAIQVVTADETQADADSYASGTTSANAGVSVSMNDESAQSMSYASSSSDVAMSGTIAIGEGQNTETDATSISNAIGSIATSFAESIGNIITVFSSSTATGQYVGGLGNAETQGTQNAGANVYVMVSQVGDNLYTVTVTASGQAEGDAQGTAWTLAYGGIIPFENIINQPQLQPIIQPVQERAFYGYTFGISDVERYWHFKAQEAVNCEDSTNSTCQRARYLLEVIVNDHFAHNATEFETKYPLEVVFQFNPKLRPVE